jgi:hypothetical protein
MTVVVAFLCTDGAVVAADSMMTPSIGEMDVGHHKGLKVEVIDGPQIFAFAGDQGQAARFKIMAGTCHGVLGLGGKHHAIEYPLALTENLRAQFSRTGLDTAAIEINTVLAFQHGGRLECCVFEGTIQPRLLDRHHFYVALGSGKQCADPFLRFLVDVFCGDGQPNVGKAVFLATWALDHVIDTNPGGVAGPIKIAVFERSPDGGCQARALRDTEIAEHRMAVESAEAALRQWRDALQSDMAADDVPSLPTPPGVARA